MTTVEDQITPRRATAIGGLILALASAAAFGLSGSLARSLLDLGWSPAAVVAVRIAGRVPGPAGALRCFCSAGSAGRRDRQSGRMVAYGRGRGGGRPALLLQRRAVSLDRGGVAAGVPGTGAADRLALGRPERSPADPTGTGRRRAVAGRSHLCSRSDQRADDQPDRRATALGAAVGLCAYFVLGEADEGVQSVHPLLLMTAGTGIGGLAVALVGVLGLLPLAVAPGTTALAGARSPGGCPCWC